jgi:hypothetical protein
MATVDKVIRAIQEQAGRINGVRYGKVVAELQDEDVVLLEVTEKYKPAKHRVVRHYCTVGSDEYVIACSCGVECRATNPDTAQELFDHHWNQQKGE